MSLIHIKNLASPFSNKVHLIAIILSVLLFAAYRLSGGAVSFQPRTETAGLQSEQNVQIERGPVDSSIRREEPATRVLERRERSQSESKSFEQLIKEDRSRNNVTQERPQQGGLSDIEKQLGLK